MRRLTAAAALVLALVAGANPAGAFVGPSARHHGWHRVSPELADALAEGDKPDATTYPWERCLTRTVGPHILVRCPDGYRTRL